MSQFEDGQNAAFTTTHWSLIVAAQGRVSPEAQKALSTLCQTYWYPLYAYARSRGRNVEDAQDLTQGFFERLLEKDYLGIADRKKGRFRWFLLTAFKGFLANEYDKSMAAKRGGGKPAISLDVIVAEQQFDLEPKSSLSPDKLFDRRWALTLLQTVQTRLKNEFQSAGKLERFEKLESYLPGERTSTSYAEAGVALGVSENAVKVEVYRMKKRFGELLRNEIAHTVASESEVEEEIRFLKQAIA